MLEKPGACLGPNTGANPLLYQEKKQISCQCQLPVSSGIGTESCQFAEGEWAEERSVSFASRIVVECCRGRLPILTGPRVGVASCQSAQKIGFESQHWELAVALTT